MTNPRPPLERRWKRLRVLIEARLDAKALAEYDALLTYLRAVEGELDRLLACTHGDEDMCGCRTSQPPAPPDAAAVERARCMREIAQHGCYCDANEIPEPRHVGSCPIAMAAALSQSAHGAELTPPKPPPERDPGREVREIGPKHTARWPHDA